MKTKEELDDLKKEVENLNKKLAELTDEELSWVAGGGYCYYRVKSGDTLESISQYLGVSQSDLISLNGIKNPDLLYVGQMLKYPS